MSQHVSHQKKHKKNKRLVLFLLICITISGCIAMNKEIIHLPYQLFTTAESQIINNKTESKFPDISKDTAYEEEWCLKLVNKWNPIKSQPDIEVIKLSNGEKVDQRIYSNLQKMFDDARDAGIYPVVASGYRTEQQQEQLYLKKIQAYKQSGLSAADAKKEAERWVAVPGTSEHQLGLAVDVNADGVYSSGADVYAWFMQNAHLYGFILRYPQEKIHLTGVANEPWHYRYVGVKAATEIYNQDICLEEYLDRVN